MPLRNLFFPITTIDVSELDNLFVNIVLFFLEHGLTYLPI